MSFMLARERIEGSKLFNIMRRMPKGALLHSHLSAMVDVRWLIEMVLEEIDGMHIFAKKALSTPEARKTETFTCLLYTSPSPRD